MPASPQPASSQKIPRYLGREEGAFVFEVAPCSRATADPMPFLASLGISKAENARIRAQRRVSHDAARAAFLIAPLGPDEALAAAARSARPLPPDAVLYEDDFCLAVHKPAPLLVHPDGTGAPALSDQVAAYLAGKGELLRPQAVQRLDVQTTGIVLFSKSVEFQGLFDALVADHTLMEKRYLAAVRGVYPVSHDRLDASIARDRHDARRMRAVAPVASASAQGPQRALTLVERLAVAPDRSASLLLVTLKTGRKHQIRVHLSARGFPVLGDTLYGPTPSAVPTSPAPLMLHAWQERFVHPVLGTDVAISSFFTERFLQLFPDVL